MSRGVGYEERRLVDRYLDREATAAETKRLEGLLETSPELAMYLVRLAALDSDLDLAFRRTEQPLDVGAETLAQEPWSRGRRWSLGVAGAVVVFAAMMFLLYGRAPTPNRTLPTFSNGAASSARDLAAPLAVRFTGSPPWCESSASDPASLDVVFGHDFDRDTQTYPSWMAGSVVRCPPGSAHNLCLRSRRMRMYPDQFGITLGDWTHVFMHYFDDQVLSFDYWVGETTTVENTPIKVGVYTEQREFFAYVCFARARARWAHAEVSLSSLRSLAGRTAAPGAGISALHLIVPFNANDVFFVDNLIVARPTTRPSTTGAP